MNLIAMPKKSAKKRPKKKSRPWLLAIPVVLLVILAIFYYMPQNPGSGMAVNDNHTKEIHTGIKIYDVNIAGSFMTIRNMESMPILTSSMHFYINEKEIQCIDIPTTLGPGQFLTCSSPSIIYCKTIRVTAPSFEDSVSCE